eukprot:SAG22_NODE_328_length_12271_cov_9.681811_8_plen_339_part_00
MITENKMITEQAAFNQEIVALNNIVVGFSQHKDMTKVDTIAADAKKLKMKLSELEDKARTFNAHEGIFGLEQTDYSKGELDEFKPLLPLVIALRNPGTQDRHWEKLSEDVGTVIKPSQILTLQGCLDMNLLEQIETIEKNPGVVDFCSNEKLLIDFQESNKLLDLVSKGLSDYLETKRAGFARFYFLSNDELLEILSQTKDPRAVQPHLRKCFEAIASLKFEDDLAMTEMISGEGEVVTFSAPLYPKGNVEDWLTQVEKVMKRSIRLAMSIALEVYYESARPEGSSTTRPWSCSTAASTSGPRSWRRRSPTPGRRAWSSTRSRRWPRSTTSSWRSAAS